MATTVVGMFDDFDQAQRAVDDLTAAGFSRDDVSLVSNNSAARFGRYEDRVQSGAGTVAGGIAGGAAEGAVIGGLTGFAAGVALLLIPGIGPIAAAGPFAAMLSGAGLGAVGGGVIGGLSKLGIPEEDAQYYAEGVRRGGTLLTLTTTSDRAAQGREIIERHSPEDVEQRGSFYRSGGYDGYSDDAPHYTPEQIEAERESYRKYSSTYAQTQGGMGDGGAYGIYGGTTGVMGTGATGTSAVGVGMTAYDNTRPDPSVVDVVTENDRPRTDSMSGSTESATDRINREGGEAHNSRTGDTADVSGTMQEGGGNLRDDRMPLSTGSGTYAATGTGRGGASAGDAASSGSSGMSSMGSVNTGTTGLGSSATEGGVGTTAYSGAGGGTTGGGMRSDSNLGGTAYSGPGDSGAMSGMQSGTRYRSRIYGDYSDQPAAMSGNLSSSTMGNPGGAGNTGGSMSGSGTGMPDTGRGGMSDVNYNTGVDVNSDDGDSLMDRGQTMSPQSGLGTVGRTTRDNPNEIR